LYVESIARLPHTFHPTDRHAIDYENWSRSDAGLRGDAFVFCTFCTPTKIDPNVFQAWVQILKRVPGSQLWLSTGANPAVETNLRRAAEEQGLGRERLVFAERIADKRRHLGRHRLADLFLDTFTVNASTMAIDALWAGLPILTRHGRHFCARNCSSFLSAVGLDDMICTTTQEYIERAVYFGTNPDAAAAVKNRLWQNRETYPLFDTTGFTRHLEDAYQTMWERWLSGEPPVSFAVCRDR
jgi:predicted O-linked N-acetylglucosamine transferase (SPINDLY family)